MPRVGVSPRAKMTYRPDQQFDGEEPFEPQGDVVVNLDERRPKASTYEMVDDEAVEADAGEDDVDYGSIQDGDFRRNLALDYDEKFLDSLGEEIVDKLVENIDERRPWRERFERGLEMMGLVESDIDDGPFPGASNAVHPLLIEARTQFWARAMGELFPPDGPAKAKVMGKQSEDLTRRAERVAEYMNFDMTVQDDAYMEESSSLIWDLPFYGSCFRKTYRDVVYNQNVGIYVPADDMIVPAEARSLKTTPHFAHRMRKTPNEVKRLQLAKYYRTVDIELPGQEEEDETQKLKDETQDVEPDGDSESVRHELLETCIEYEMPGDEHEGEDGEPTGLLRSYYVTVDRHSRKVLSIYRGWNPNDPLCRRKLYFEHWKFAPGQGFYGSGLFHLIGGLQIAATGALRVLLDSAASASLSGGFMARHSNLKGKRITLTPGHWEPVDVPGEDLAKMFYSPPVKEPSAALFQLLGFLTERGEKYTATTELMTGDGDPKGAPVGTTNMMLEQGGKVMSTIHRMNYGSLGRELRTRYELDREYAPPEGYPYDVGDDQPRTVYSDDFAPGVSVVPVADPNIFSSAQRMAQAQAVYQIALESGTIPLPKAVRRVLKAMRIADIDELMPEDPQPQTYDPVGEIQALFLGKPVKVDPSQPHVMHVQVLAAFANNPQYGGNEQVQKQIGPQLMAILGQHMAYAWATHARGLGVPVNYMDPQSGKVAGAPGTPEQIAGMLAQLAPQLATVPGLPAIDAEGKDKGDDAQVERAKLELAREKHQMDMQHDKDKHTWEMEKQKQKLEAERQMMQLKVQIATQKAQADAEIARVEAQQSMQQTQMEGQIAQQQATQQAEIDQQTAQRQQQMDEQSMQVEQAQGQQKMQHEAQMGQQKLHMQHAQGQQKMQQDKLQSLRQPQGQPHAHPHNPARPHDEQGQ